MLIKDDKVIPQFGDVYEVGFHGIGSVQTGLRLGLVFQNNIGNEYSPNVVLLPLTTSLKKLNQPTHALLEAKKTGLPKDSMVLCENPECIPKELLGKFITKIPYWELQNVIQAYLLASSAICFLDEKSIAKVKYVATRLNNALSTTRV